MIIVLKIVSIIIAVILTIPVEYSLFPKLDRQSGENAIKGDLFPWSILLCVVVFIIEIAIGVCYLFVNDRGIWYLYLVPMVCPIFFQFLFACSNLQKRLLPVVLPILAIAFIGCIILPIRDEMLKYELELSNSEMVVETEEPLLSKTEVKARLNATSISEASYDSNGDQYIYEINQGKSGYGLALVDAQKMEFLPCKYENQISGIIREHYPKEEIVQFGIEIRESVPYAKFGILKRPRMFSKPEIDFYVLLDMEEGKMKKEETK